MVMYVNTISHLAFHRLVVISILSGPGKTENSAGTYFFYKHTVGANWIYSRYTYALAVRNGKNMLIVCLCILLS